MNWLAHIFLSGNQIEYQLGNLLADLLKGKSWPGADPLFNKGLAMHRIIDRHTDQHPAFKASMSRLGSQGRLRGVVIDITYDHLLAKNWQDYSDIPLKDFIEEFHQQTQKVMHRYPEEAQQFLSRLVATGHLFHYQTLQGLEQALRRIDSRLSPRVLRRESTRDYLPSLLLELPSIEEDFLLFMPDLINHFKEASGLTTEDHWLR